MEPTLEGGRGIAARRIGGRFQYCRPVADAPQDSADANRPPRGALVVIAIGLVACAVAALASTGKGEGEAASLEWVQSSKGPDSKSVAVPGGEGTMRLTDTNIRATGTNVSGYSLYI